MGHIDAGMIFQHYRQLVMPAEAEWCWNLKPQAQADRKIVAIEPHTPAVPDQGSTFLLLTLGLLALGASQRQLLRKRA